MDEAFIGDASRDGRFTAITGKDLNGEEHTIILSDEQARAFGIAQPDAGDVEALALGVYQSVQESILFDDDAIPYIFGSDATDEQKDAEERLFGWVVDRAAEAAKGAVEDLAEDLLREAAAREAQLRGALTDAARDLWQATRLLERMVLNPSETTIADATTWYPQGFKQFDAADKALALPASDAAKRVLAVIEKARLVAKAADEGHWLRLAVIALRDAIQDLDGKDGAE